MRPQGAPDLTRYLLAILSLLILIGGSLWVMLPFLAATIWAAMVVIATWPLMTQVQQWLWGRRGLAATVMLLALLLLFFVPLALAIAAIVDNVDQFIDWAKHMAQFAGPTAPEWLQQLPGVGPRIAQLWGELMADGAAPLMAKLAPYAGVVAKGALREAGAIGAVAMQFLTTLAISGVLYMYGEEAAAGVLRFARRLAGAQGEKSVLLAAAATRGVALGVVITAVVQAMLGGLGLLVTGVPGAMLLTAVMFLLTIAQIGPIPVLGAAVVWLFYSDATGWAVALAVWTLMVGTIDNIIRPWLIRKGADLPLLLIFAGVIGGLMAFGLIGIFIGPVVLAVTYRLMGAWMEEEGH